MKEFNQNLEEKKLDPVGREDSDVDNDGDVDSSDKYLMKRRKAIGKAIGKKKYEKRHMVRIPNKCKGISLLQRKKDREDKEKELEAARQEREDRKKEELKGIEKKNAIKCG